MVKWPKNVLKRKPVNGRNLVIEIVVTKGVFTEPRINLVGCRVGVGDAGYAPGGVLHRLNAMQELRYNDARLPTSGA